MRHATSLAWAAAIAAACGVGGNGQVTSEVRTVGAFTAVRANNAVEVRLTMDAEATGDVELTVRAESNLLERIETQVTGEALVVDTIGSFRATDPMDIEGSPARVASAEADNAATLSLQDLAGAAIVLSVNNAGRIDAQGAVQSLTVDANNAGEVNASGLTVSTATIDVDNGATATVCASESVTGTVNNGGNLTVQCGADASGVSTRNGGTCQGC